MALTFLKNYQGQRTEYAPLDEVIRRAKQAKNPNFSKALAVTIPLRDVDLYFKYDPSQSPVGTFIKFRKGTIHFTLGQAVFITKTLPSCAQGIYEAHERGHIQDNINILNKMEKEIRSDSALKEFFFQSTWFHKLKKNTKEEELKTDIKNIFDDLAIKAVKQRDTSEEYIRLSIEIFQKCPEKFYHVVKRGDWLSKIARLYYGNTRLWPLIYKKNKHIIGPNPDLISPGDQLEIPKN